MIHFLTPAGEQLMRNYLDVRGSSIADHIEIVHYEHLPQTFRSGTYVFSALEQLSAPMERLVHHLYDALSRQEGVRLLNRPGRSLRRYELLQALHARGLNDHQARLASEDFRMLRFPVFIRSERTHEGSLTPLLDDQRDVEAWIGRLRVIGWKPDQLLVVEFNDTSDDEGRFRKFAAFIIGDRILPRSVDYGSDWMLKRKRNVYTHDALAAEYDYITQNPHERELRQIFSVAGIDYGRIDYAVKDGRIQTWEINLHPTLGRGRKGSENRAPGELEAIHAATKEYVHQQLREAWLAIDTPSDRSLSLSLSLDASLVRAAAAAPRPGYRSPAVAAVRRALRPLKPFILKYGASMFRRLSARRRPAG